MRRRLLLVGPVPPPAGGITTATRLLLDSALQERVTLRHCPNSNSREVRKKGLIDLPNLLSFAGQCLRLLREVVAFRPDLVQIESSTGLSFLKNGVLAMLGRALGRRVIVSIHSAREGRPLGDFVAQGGLQERIAGFFLRRISAVRVLNRDWEEDFALQWGVKRRRVRGIPNAVDFAEMPGERRAPQGETVVLFLGWICRPKGIFELLEAAAELRPRYPELRLEILGPERDPGAWQEVRDRIAELGLGEVARLVEEKPRLEALQAYGRCHVYALPSYTEGMPMGILEAMACGLPIVATRVGAIASVVEEGRNGLLVPPRDVTALRTALERLLADPDLRREMGEHNTRKVRDHYSIDAQIDQFCRLYEEVLAGEA